MRVHDIIDLCLLCFECVVREALRGKTNEEYIEIIRTKGEAKKKQIFETAKFQTSDYQQVKKLVEDLQAEEIRLT